MRTFLTYTTHETHIFTRTQTRTDARDFGTRTRVLMSRVEQVASLPHHMNPQSVEDRYTKKETNYAYKTNSHTHTHTNKSWQKKKMIAYLNFILQRRNHL